MNTGSQSAFTVCPVHTPAPSPQLLASGGRHLPPGLSEGNCLVFFLGVFEPRQEPRACFRIAKWQSLSVPPSYSQAQCATVMPQGSVETAGGLTFTSYPSCQASARFSIWAPITAPITKDGEWLLCRVSLCPTPLLSLLSLCPFIKVQRMLALPQPQEKAFYKGPGHWLFWALVPRRGLGYMYTP